MAVITVVLLGVLGVLGAALSRLVADDIKAWTPRLTRYLVKCAVRILLEQQEHYAEEWSAHLDQIPGDLSKIVMAVDLLRAAKKEKAQQIQRLQDTLVNALISIDYFIGELNIVTPLSFMVTRVKKQIVSLPDNFVYNENFAFAKTEIFEFDQHVKTIISDKDRCVKNLLKVKVDLSDALHDEWDDLKVEKLKETHDTLVEVGVLVRNATLEMQNFLNDRASIQKCIANGIALRIPKNAE